MTYIKLFLTFTKIGLFSFGGGYAMIPLIQNEIYSNRWMNPSDFADIIAIAEMTPGPIAVNSATFIGYKVGGIIGGFIATLGVTIPSLLIILVISRFFLRFKNHPLNKMIFYGIRPVIVALIAMAAVYVGETTFINTEINNIQIFDILNKPLEFININSLLIFTAVLLAVAKLKLNPILAIIGSGALGILLFL